MKSELEHLNNFGVEYKKVNDILKSQSDLKRLMNNYEMESYHKPDPQGDTTFGDYMFYHWWYGEPSRRWRELIVLSLLLLSVITRQSLTCWRLILAWEWNKFYQCREIMDWQEVK